jgi:hypothetical protein
LLLLLPRVEPRHADDDPWRCSATIDAKALDDATPLEFAAQKGNLAAVRELLAAGAATKVCLAKNLKTRA